MKDAKTNDRQEVMKSAKRSIFRNVILSVILFLFALFSFLRGGWFILLAILFGLALCYVVVWLGLTLIVFFSAKFSPIVERQVLETERKGIFTKERAVLRFRSKDTDTLRE